MKQFDVGYEALQTIAQECGVTLAGVAPVDSLRSEVQRLGDWQSAGHAGGMKYMLRDPSLLTDPTRILPSAKSIVSVAISYPASPRQDLPTGWGRVARYAWGVDYHQVIPRILQRLVESVQRHLGYSIEYKVMTDAVPLLERALGRHGGLGFVGKNTMLIASRYGSYFFLGEVIWNVAISPQAVPSEPRGSCGACSRCQTGCPTNAFSAPYTLDARKCISYLTIEKPGILSVEDRRSVGEWIFGCDVCQEACPFNALPVRIGGRSGAAHFHREEGSLGPFLKLADVLEIRSERQFSDRFARSPMLRPRRAGLLRNAAMVAANTRATSALPLLVSSGDEDNSPTVRATSTWAAAELVRTTGEGRDEVIKLLDRRSKDPDTAVAVEARANLEAF